MRILYVTASQAYFTNNVYDFDHSFSQYSKHDLFYFDISKNAFDIDLHAFDAILFSYSFLAHTDKFSHSLTKKINKFTGLKIPVLQDDYLYFLKHRDNLAAFGINAIVTIVPPQYWDKVFFGPFAHLPKLQVLTGYVTENMERQFSERLPLNARKWKIGYRSRPMKPIFGALCHEKFEIGSTIKQLCEREGISCNIEVAEEKRIYGKAWPAFIRNCQVLLGTESGCNVFDFSGKIDKKIKAYQKKFPEAGVWDIHKNCIGEAEGIIKTNQISPRIFEAVALGTGHILFEGEYSGIIKPWEHYIPLKKDYSNIDEVLTALGDLELLERMITRSYEDVVASGKYSYRVFVGQVDKFLESLPAKNNSVKKMPYSSKIERYAPQRLCNLDTFPLQRKAEQNTHEIAQKYVGKNILVYGAGAAYRKYIKYFSGSHILGIILDDDFLDQNPAPMPDAPYMSFEQAAQCKKKVDGIIIFCRPQFCFAMSEKIADFSNLPQIPECCVLFL